MCRRACFFQIRTLSWFQKFLTLNTKTSIVIPFEKATFHSIPSILHIHNMVNYLNITIASVIAKPVFSQFLLYHVTARKFQITWRKRLELRLCLKKWCLGGFRSGLVDWCVIDGSMVDVFFRTFFFCINPTSWIQDIRQFVLIIHSKPKKTLR